MRVSKLCETLFTDNKGNIAVLFSIAILPILTFMGAAVDYSAASVARTKMQTSLDTALLAGAIAGKASLNSGSDNSTAIAAAKTAALNFFSGNQGINPGVLTADFTIDGSTMSGTGSASGIVITHFMKIVGFPTMPINATANSSSTAQPYQNVYLLVDISASMLLPSTDSGITQMRNGQGGCALACHDRTDGKDSYGWAKAQGIQLRYEVLNNGVENLLSYLKSDQTLSTHVKVGLWSFDHTLTQNASVTSTYSAISNNYPLPSLASTDAAAATPFNDLIGDFITAVGKGGDGSSASNPMKLVIIATDGVNDPTRAWVYDTSLRPQVKVFDTGFCTTLQKNNVTVATINTPYLPMTWDWGYVATLGQPGSLGGATRVDDIPIALTACAGTYFTVASQVAAIQSSFVKLFTMASPIKLTK